MNHARDANESLSEYHARIHNYNEAVNFRLRRGIGVIWPAEKGTFKGDNSYPGRKRRIAKNAFKGAKLAASIKDSTILQGYTGWGTALHRPYQKGMVPVNPPLTHPSHPINKARKALRDAEAIISRESDYAKRQGRKGLLADVRGAIAEATKEAFAIYNNCADYLTRVGARRA